MNKSLSHRKKYIISALSFVIMVSLLFTSCNFNSNTNKQALAPNEIVHNNAQLPKPDEEKMMNTITKLSTHSRAFCSNDEKSACEYLKNELKSYEYDPVVQTFKGKKYSKNSNGTAKEGESQNLIAVKKCNSKNSKGIVVITAHYDCEENSLGANDDGSGVAVVMEIARLLNSASSDFELRFILFGGEEAGISGSRYYVDSLSSEDKKNIKANIDIDCIAQNNLPNPDIFTMSGKTNSATDILKSSEKNKGLEIKKANREMSDYVAFDMAKIPALCIGQAYTEDLKINGPKDAVSLIDKSKLKFVADMVLNSILQK